MTKRVGRKILICADSERDLPVLLRHLAQAIEDGNMYMNVADGLGVRIMRPLTEKEEDCYLSAGDLP